MAVNKNSNLATYLWDTLLQRTYCHVIKVNDVQGELIDVSARRLVSCLALLLVRQFQCVIQGLLIVLMLTFFTGGGKTLAVILVN